MNRLLHILLLLLLFAAPVTAGEAAAHSSGKEGVDVKEIIFEHVQDTYEWHITTIGEKHVAISLPVILYSQRTGWEVFPSSVFHNVDSHNGFYIYFFGGLFQLLLWLTNYYLSVN